MQTEYQHSVTIAVPAPLIPDANHLALCLGESSSDDQTFGDPRWQDAEGSLYAIASTVAKPVFAQLAGQPLQAPDHAPDVDLEAAARAQALLVIEDRINGGAPVTVSPDHIAAIIDHRLADAQEHIAALGLVAVVSEEEL